jgi:hypothetical protein
LDKAEWLHDIQNGDCSLKGFLSIVGDSINEREIRRFEEGLNSKVNHISLPHHHLLNILNTSL